MSKWKLSEIAKYLDRYGYFHPYMRDEYDKYSIKPPQASLVTDGNSDVNQALRLFQLKHDIDATGEFDSITEEFFDKPRCGVPDYSVRGGFLGFRHINGDLIYSILNNLPNLTTQQQQTTFRDAFNLWANSGIPLRFNEAASGQLTIRSVVGANEFYGISDGPGHILGVTVTPNIPIPIGFDAAERFSIGANPPAGSFSLLSVAAHEFGHSIGLAHSDSSSALMYAYYNGRLDLSQDDIDTVRALYPHWWGSGWQDMRGFATSIAVGANGTVWTIGRDGAIDRWNEAGQFWEDRPFGGWGWCVAVTPDGRPWVIGGGDDGDNNNIYEWVNNRWEGRGGWAYDLAIGANGHVFHIGRGGAIYGYTGNNNWQYLPGAVVHQPSPHGSPWGHSIAVTPSGECWHIGDGQEIFRPSGGNWQGTGAFAYALGCGPRGELMSVGRGSKIWIWEGGRWNDGWSDAYATSVEVGPGGQSYHNGNDRGIFRRILR